MKIAIAIASKTGTTEKCAGILGEKLQDAEIINLQSQKINLKKYDLIILGSPIRMGVIHPKIRELITNNMDILKKKKLAMFICCGTKEKYKEYFINNISKELLHSFIAYDTFGGELDMSKQKGMDKFIVKMMAKKMGNIDKIKIDKNRILDFAKKVNEKKK